MRVLRVLMNSLEIEMDKEKWLRERPSFRSLVGKTNLIGVEIGVDSGLNAVNILTHLDIKKLYLIDPWVHYGGMSGHGAMSPEDAVEKCYEHTVKITEQFKDKVVIIRDFSSDVVGDIPNNLNFVYIDGNHRFEYVLQDIENYLPKITSNGQIAGHDFKSGELGVVNAVKELFGNKYRQDTWDWWYSNEA